MKFFSQLFLAILLIAKLVLGSVFIYRAQCEPLPVPAEAAAAGVPAETPGVPAQAGQAEKEIPETLAKGGLGLDLLAEENAELQRREKALQEEMAQLAALKQELNNRMAALRNLRNKIKADLAEKEQKSASKLKHLVKAYSAMRAQIAAKLVERLDTDFAVRVLAQMKADQVGKILSFVKVDKAAEVSKGLAKQP